VALKNNWMEITAVFLILFTVIIIWPLTRKPRFLALPFFLGFGALSVLFFVDHSWEKQIFILLSALTYYLAVLGGYRLRFYDCDQTALGMVNLATIATVFFWLASALAWFLNYQIDIWIMIPSFFFAVFLISLPSFFICVRDRQEREKKGGKIGGKCLCYCDRRDLGIITVVFLAAVFAFAATQTFWGLLFLPFGYLTLSVCGLIIFYEFWDVVRVYLRGELTPKRIIMNLLLGAFLFTGILITAQWELVV
jgi:hypothetical protein